MDHRYFRTSRNTEESYGIRRERYDRENEIPETSFFGERGMTKNHMVSLRNRQEDSPCVDAAERNYAQSHPLGEEVPSARGHYTRWTPPSPFSNKEACWNPTKYETMDYYHGRDIFSEYRRNWFPLEKEELAVLPTPPPFYYRGREYRDSVKRGREKSHGAGGVGDPGFGWRFSSFESKAETMRYREERKKVLSEPSSSSDHSQRRYPREEQYRPRSRSPSRSLHSRKKSRQAYDHNSSYVPKADAEKNWRDLDRRERARKAIYEQIDNSPVKERRSERRKKDFANYNKESVIEKPNSVFDKKSYRDSDKESVLSEGVYRDSDKESVLSERDYRDSDKESVFSERDYRYSDKESVLSERDYRDSDKESVLSEGINRDSDKESVLSEGINRDSDKESVLSEGINRNSDKGTVLSEGINQNSDKGTVLLEGINRNTDKGTVLLEGINRNTDKGTVLSEGINRNSDKGTVLSEGINRNSDKGTVLSEGINQNSDKVTVLLEGVNSDSEKGSVLSEGVNSDSEKGSVLSEGVNRDSDETVFSGEVNPNFPKKISFELSGHEKLKQIILKSKLKEVVIKVIRWREKCVTPHQLLQDEVTPPTGPGISKAETVDITMEYSNFNTLKSESNQDSSSSDDLRLFLEEDSEEEYNSSTSTVPYIQNNTKELHSDCSTSGDVSVIAEFDYSRDITCVYIKSEPSYTRKEEQLSLVKTGTQFKRDQHWYGRFGFSISTQLIKRLFLYIKDFLFKLPPFNVYGFVCGDFSKLIWAERTFLTSVFEIVPHLVLPRTLNAVTYFLYVSPIMTLVNASTQRSFPKYSHILKKITRKRSFSQDQVTGEHSARRTWIKAIDSRKRLREMTTHPTRNNPKPAPKTNYTWNRELNKTSISFEKNTGSKPERLTKSTEISLTKETMQHSSFEDVRLPEPMVHEVVINSSKQMNRRPPASSINRQFSLDEGEFKRPRRRGAHPSHYKRENTSINASNLIINLNVGTSKTLSPTSPSHTPSNYEARSFYPTEILKPKQLALSRPLSAQELRRGRLENFKKSSNEITVVPVKLSAMDAKRGRSGSFGAKDRKDEPKCKTTCLKAMSMPSAEELFAENDRKAFKRGNLEEKNLIECTSKRQKIQITQIYNSSNIVPQQEYSRQIEKDLTSMEGKTDTVDQRIEGLSPEDCLLNITRYNTTTPKVPSNNHIKEAIIVSSKMSENCPVPNGSNAQEKALKPNANIAQEEALETKATNAQEKALKLNDIGNAQETSLIPNATIAQEEALETKVMNAQETSLIPNATIAQEEALETKVMNAQEKPLKPNDISNAQEKPLKPNDISNAQEKALKLNDISNAQEKPLKLNDISNAQEKLLKPNDISNAQENPLKLNDISNAQEKKLSSSQTPENHAPEIKPANLLPTINHLQPSIVHVHLSSSSYQYQDNNEIHPLGLVTLSHSTLSEPQEFDPLTTGTEANSTTGVKSGQTPVETELEEAMKELAEFESSLLIVEEQLSNLLSQNPLDKRAIATKTKKADVYRDLIVATRQNIDNLTAKPKSDYWLEFINFASRCNELFENVASLKITVYADPATLSDYKTEMEQVSQMATEMESKIINEEFIQKTDCMKYLAIIFEIACNGIKRIETLLQRPKVIKPDPDVDVQFVCSIKAELGRTFCKRQERALNTRSNLLIPDLNMESDTFLARVSAYVEKNPEIKEKLTEIVGKKPELNDPTNIGLINKNIPSSVPTCIRSEMSQYVNDNTPTTSYYANKGFTPTNSPSTFTPTNSPSTFTPTNSPSTFTPTNSPSTFTPTNSLSTITSTNSLSTITATNSLSTFTPSNSLSTFTPTNSLSTFTPTNSLSTFTPTNSLSIFTPTNSLSIFTPTNSLSTFTPTNSLSTFSPTNSLSTFTPTNSQPTFTPTNSQPTFTPNNSQPTFTPTNSQPTFTPTNSQPTFTPNNSQPTFTPNNSQPTFTPNNSQSTFTPNNSQSTFTPNNSQSTFTPNNSQSTFTPNNSQSTFTPNNSQPTFTPNNSQPASTPTNSRLTFTRPNLQLTFTSNNSQQMVIQSSSFEKLVPTSSYQTSIPINSNRTLVPSNFSRNQNQSGAFARQRPYQQRELVPNENESFQQFLSSVSSNAEVATPQARVSNLTVNNPQNYASQYRPSLYSTCQTNGRSQSVAPNPPQSYLCGSSRTEDLSNPYRISDTFSTLGLSNFRLSNVTQQSNPNHSYVQMMLRNQETLSMYNSNENIANYNRNVLPLRHPTIESEVPTHRQGASSSRRSPQNRQSLENNPLYAHIFHGDKGHSTPIPSQSPVPSALPSAIPPHNFNAQLTSQPSRTVRPGPSRSMQNVLPQSSASDMMPPPPPPPPYNSHIYQRVQNQRVVTPLPGSPFVGGFFPSWHQPQLNP